MDKDQIEAELNNQEEQSEEDEGDPEWMDVDIEQLKAPAIPTSNDN
jgi:hypothetical protein